MKRLQHYAVLTSLLALVLSPILGVQTAQAITYDARTLPYTDRTSFDANTAVSVSVLTEAGVVQGNPDGSFRPFNPVNRAEFVKIAMELAPDTAAANVSTDCFVDVAPYVWYARPVCRAKALGYVRGNAEEGVPMEDWRFEPIRRVNYAEAVKVFTELYAIPLHGSTEGEAWYVPYITAAINADVALRGRTPSDALTRAEIAQLAARFYAYSHGELESLDAAIERYDNQQYSSSSSSVSSTAVHPDFIVLGETSPILGSIEVFSSAESISVDMLHVTLEEAVPTVEAFLVFDGEGRFLGRATQDGATARYTLRLTSTTQFSIPQRVTTRLFVRADTRSELENGVSGERVHIASIGVEGTGQFTGSLYQRETTESFPIFVTANGRITAITNAGVPESTLLTGTERTVGEFTFSGETSDGGSDLRITDLTFTIEQFGNVTVDNVSLARASFSTTFSCSNDESYIYCRNIPESIGTLTGGRTSLRVIADVDVADETRSASLRLRLQDAGSPQRAGAVAWSDEDSTFTWVQLSSPLAQGTLYTR